MPAPTRVVTQNSKDAVAAELPKDDVELRLEKALFGDDAGFLESLKRYRSQEDRVLARCDRDGEEGPDEEGGSGDNGDDVSTTRDRCTP